MAEQDKPKERVYLIAIGPPTKQGANTYKASLAMQQAGATQLWPGVWVLKTAMSKQELDTLVFSSATGALAPALYMLLRNEELNLRATLGSEQFMVPGPMDRVVPLGG